MYTVPRLQHFLIFCANLSDPFLSTVLRSRIIYLAGAGARILLIHFWILPCFSMNLSNKGVAEGAFSDFHATQGVGALQFMAVKRAKTWHLVDALRVAALQFDAVQ
jgi:hypothetical protein